MKPFVYTVEATAGGNTYSNVYIVDHYTSPANLAIGVTVVGAGSCGYTVQHTFRDPFTINLNNPSNGVWFDNEYLVNASANADTNYAFPPTAIRLLVSAATSASATLNIVQAGPR